MQKHFVENFIEINYQLILAHSSTLGSDEECLITANEAGYFAMALVSSCDEDFDTIFWRLFSKIESEALALSQKTDETPIKINVPCDSPACDYQYRELAVCR